MTCKMVKPHPIIYICLELILWTSSSSHLHDINIRKKFVIPQILSLIIKICIRDLDAFTTSPNRSRERKFWGSIKPKADILFEKVPAGGGFGAAPGPAKGGLDQPRLRWQARSNSAHWRPSRLPLRASGYLLPLVLKAFPSLGLYPPLLFLPRRRRLGERRRHLSLCWRWAHPPGMPTPSLSFCCARRSTPNPNKIICIRIWIQLQYITY